MSNPPLAVASGRALLLHLVVALAILAPGASRVRAAPPATGKAPGGSRAPGAGLGGLLDTLESAGSDVSALRAQARDLDARRKQLDELMARFEALNRQYDARYQRFMKSVDALVGAQLGGGAGEPDLSRPLPEVPDLPPLDLPPLPPLDLPSRGGPSPGYLPGQSPAGIPIGADGRLDLDAGRR